MNTHYAHTRTQQMLIKKVGFFQPSSRDTKSTYSSGIHRSVRERDGSCERFSRGERNPR